MIIFRKPAVRAVFAALTLIMIFFIFYMSSFSSDDSSRMSMGLLELINSFFEHIGIGGFLTEHIVRKLAHFTEFFILGGLLYADVLGFYENSFKNITIPACVGLIVAAADEFSQSFSYGRSPEIFDVLIDFTGVLSAVIICFIICKIYLKIQKKPRIS